MHRPKPALIRLGRGYSAVGTAVEERDPRGGRRMLHLRLAASAADVYVPLEDDPASPEEMEAADELWPGHHSPLPAGHA